MRAVVATLVFALGCRDTPAADRAAPVEAVSPAPRLVSPPKPAPETAAVAGGRTAGWPELADLPKVDASLIFTIPTRPSVPRFSVGGPALRGDVAVVSSSQFGFAAVDWRRGALLWTKPAGIKVAPPLARGDGFVLIGDCLTPPAIPDAHVLLGCVRVVSAEGTDEAYIAIHGPAATLETFLGTPGEQAVWAESDRTVRWRRGEAAVLVDLISGIAIPTSAATPPVVVEHAKRRWEIAHVDGKIVATERGKRAWGTNREVTALLGAVRIPEQGPMIRMANISSFGGAPEVRILDMDATGSMNGTASWTPVPGISLLGKTISPVGDAALAVRLDSSIKRDFIAAYAASALLIYVFPLPEVLRPDPVGVAIALDENGHAEAVVAFYDGDQLAVLPNVSAPPTAPGATAGPLENSTP